MKRPSREQLRQLRARGLTLAEIGRRYFSPPVSKQRVLQLCGHVDVRRQHFVVWKAKLAAQATITDTARAAQITADKKKFWGAA